MKMIERTKPFDIPKSLVFLAYKRVKENRGGAGIDDLTIEKFDQDLSKNLYKLWNRLSSGSYFPPAVKACDITKADGGTRRLGIPTVSDRIAQEVVRSVLEPELEKVFDEDSYGYRPNKSALGASRKGVYVQWEPTHQDKSRSPVTRVAIWRETKMLKLTDSIIEG